MMETVKKFEDALNNMMGCFIVNDVKTIQRMDETTFKSIKASLDFIDAANELTKEQAKTIEEMDRKLDSLTEQLNKLLSK